MSALKERYKRTRDTFLRKGFGSRTVESAFEQGQESGGGLRAVFGPIDLIMLGVGAIIGAGVFVLTGEAAREFAGPSIIVSYLLSSIAAMLLALSYVEFAVEIPVTGGAFNYIRLVQGEFLAWQAGACLILEYTLGSAAVSKGFSGYLASLLGLDTSTFVFDAWIFDVDVLAFCLISVLTLFTYLGTKESASFNTVVAFTNLLVIFFVLGAAASETDRDNYTPFLPLGTQNMFRAAAVVFFAYIGFDSLVTVAAEVKNPKRDMPLGVVGSIGISAVLYILMATALSGMQPYNEIDPTAPFSEAFVAADMRWAGRIVSVGALTGIVTSLLVSLLGQSRIFIVLGREKLLPSWLATIDEKRSTPKHALVATWLSSGCLALLFDIDILSRMVSMGTLFVLGLVSLAAIQRMYTPQDSRSGNLMPLNIRLALLVLGSIVEGSAFAADSHPAVYGTSLCFVLIVTLSFYQLPVMYVPKNFITPLKPLTPCAAVLAAVHFMFSLGWEAHLLFLVWQIAGIVIYIVYGMHRTAEPDVVPMKQIQMQPGNEKDDERQNSNLLHGIAEQSDSVSNTL